jgi:hypothetical protein
MSVEAIIKKIFQFRMTGEVIVRVRRWDDYLERMVDTDEERRVYFDGLANLLGGAEEVDGTPRAVDVEAADPEWTMLG